MSDPNATPRAGWVLMVLGAAVLCMLATGTVVALVLFSRGAAAPAERPAEPRYAPVPLPPNVAPSFGEPLQPLPRANLSDQGAAREEPAALPATDVERRRGSSSRDPAPTQRPSSRAEPGRSEPPPPPDAVDPLDPLRSPLDHFPVRLP